MPLCAPQQLGAGLPIGFNVFQFSVMPSREILSKLAFPGSTAFQASSKMTTITIPNTVAPLSASRNSPGVLEITLQDYLQVTKPLSGYHCG